VRNFGRRLCQSSESTVVLLQFALIKRADIVPSVRESYVLTGPVSRDFGKQALQSGSATTEDYDRTDSSSK